MAASERGTERPLFHKHLTHSHIAIFRCGDAEAQADAFVARFYPDDRRTVGGP